MLFGVCCIHLAENILRLGIFFIAFYTVCFGKMMRICHQFFIFFLQLIGGRLLFKEVEYHW